MAAEHYGSAAVPHVERALLHPKRHCALVGERHRGHRVPCRPVARIRHHPEPVGNAVLVLKQNHVPRAHADVAAAVTHELLEVLNAFRPHVTDDGARHPARHHEKVEAVERTIAHVLAVDKRNVKFRRTRDIADQLCGRKPHRPHADEHAGTKRTRFLPNLLFSWQLAVGRASVPASRSWQSSRAAIPNRAFTRIGIRHRVEFRRRIKPDETPVPARPCAVAQKAVHRRRGLSAPEQLHRIARHHLRPVLRHTVIRQHPKEHIHIAESWELVIGRASVPASRNPKRLPEPLCEQVIDLLANDLLDARLDDFTHEPRPG